MMLEVILNCSNISLEYLKPLLLHSPTKGPDLFFSFPNVAHIEKMLISGTSINIDYLASLKKEKMLFPDEELQNYISGWQIRYQPITREFILYHENDNPLRSRDLSSLLVTIFSHYTFSLHLIEPLKENEKYYVEIFIGLRHATVPPWLEKTLFFWTWDISKASYTLQLAQP